MADDKGGTNFKGNAQSDRAYHYEIILIPMCKRCSNNNEHYENVVMQWKQRIIIMRPFQLQQYIIYKYTIY